MKCSIADTAQADSIQPIHDQKGAPMSSTLTTLTCETVSNWRAERLGSSKAAALRTGFDSNPSFVNADAATRISDANLTAPVGTFGQEWTIAHMPTTGLEFGLAKTYRQQPLRPPPG